MSDNSESSDFSSEEEYDIDEKQTTDTVENDGSGNWCRSLKYLILTIVFYGFLSSVIAYASTSTNNGF